MLDFDARHRLGSEEGGWGADVIMDVGSPFRPWPTYDPFSLKVRTTGNFHKMGPRSLAAIALPRGAAAEDRRAGRDQSERDDATGGRAGPRGRVVLLLQASGLSAFYSGQVSRGGGPAVDGRGAEVVKPRSSYCS